MRLRPGPYGRHELFKAWLLAFFVAPGPVWTPLIPASFSAEKVSEFGKNNPMERPAQPSELAHIFVLLASPVEGSFMKGGIYDVTGGKSTA